MPPFYLRNHWLMGHIAHLVFSKIKTSSPIAFTPPTPTQPRLWVDDVYEPSQSLGKDAYLNSAPHRGGERACGRWLLPTECLLFQAFPVHPVLHQNFKICAFNWPRPGRKARHVMQQAGNSMHTICPFICALHSAVCWKPYVESDRTVHAPLLTF